MASTVKTRKGRSSKTTPPPTARYRVLTSIYNTMREFRTRQGALDAVWWFGGHAVSSYQALPTPLPPPSESSSLGGNLDLSFGTDGFNTDTPGTKDQIQAITIQSGGTKSSLSDKILAVGYATPGSQVAIMSRYNSDGSLDTSFGTSGFITVYSTGTGPSINSIAIQSDGKIVCAGGTQITSVWNFLLARYNPDGTIDTSFGTNGYVLVNYGFDVDVQSVAVQSDGKIVVGGDCYLNSTYLFFITRYNSDGTLDTSFGTNGYNNETPGEWDRIESIAILSDGKIVAGGYLYLYSTGQYYFCVARYNSDGSLDTSFGTNGYNQDTPASNDWINSIAIQSDGKIVAVGAANYYAFAVGRYNSDGSLDTDFAADGYNILTPGTSDSLNSVVVQSDGKIVSGGYYTNPDGHQYFAIIRYNSDGLQDMSFGTNGYNLLSPGTKDGIQGIAFMSDGSLVAGGHYTGSSGNPAFALAHYV